MPDPREAALLVFLDWAASRTSADELLSARLGGDQLSARDRDLVTELVWGVFRWRGRLDWQLAAIVHRPLEDLHPPVLWILRLGLYQLEHLDRIPAHAAVNSAVELAKRFGHRGSASLVNAVLRAAPRVLPTLVEPDAATDPLAHLSARTSHPEWLLERWLARVGFRRTLALAARNNERPVLTLRVVSARVEPRTLAAELRRRGVQTEPGVHLADRLRLPGGWCPAVREVLEGGLAVVQDEAAGLVSQLVQAAPDMSVLDVCSAPGGKALQLAEQVGRGIVVAGDVSLRRLRLLQASCRRLGERRVQPVAADGLAPATGGGFDRVLVDAPCSNTGVLGRRPDARWRREPQDLPRLARLQGELLDAARTQVRPGGLLVYATCSLEPEENEEVVRDYLERHREDGLLPAECVLPGDFVENGFLRTDPARQPLDGAFGAILELRGTGGEQE